MTSLIIESHKGCLICWAGIQLHQELDKLWFSAFWYFRSEGGGGDGADVDGDDNDADQSRSLWSMMLLNADAEGRDSDADLICGGLVEEGDTDGIEDEQELEEA